MEETKQGRENEPRNVAVYLTRKRCGWRLDEIAKEFELTKYSSVSSIVTRTEKFLAQDKELNKRVEGIKAQCEKGQAKI